MGTKEKIDVSDLFVKWTEIRQKKRDLEKEEALLKELLTKAIPENGEKSGVIHRVSETKAVSYAKALPEIEALIPKTRVAEVPSILERFTTTSYRHDFKTA